MSRQNNSLMDDNGQTCAPPDLVADVPDALNQEEKRRKQMEMSSRKIERDLNERRLKIFCDEINRRREIQELRTNRARQRIRWCGLALAGSCVVAAGYYLYKEGFTIEGFTFNQLVTD